MRCTTALLALLAACSSLPKQTMPKPEELVASLPRLQADDPSIHTLHVLGRLKANAFGGHLDARTELYIQRPGACALYVFDARDETPIIVASRGAAFVYDARQGVLHWAAPAFPEFDFSAENRDLRFIWGIDHRDHPTVDVSIDLPSIAELLPVDRTVQRSSDDTVRLLSRSTKGATLTIDFVKEGQYVPASLALHTNDAAGTVMLLEKIVINGDIPDDAFIALQATEWAKAAPLTRLDGDDPSTQPLGKLSIVTSFGLRGVMKSATGSHQLPDGTVLDWSKLREQDARIAPLLRSVLAQAKATASK